MIKYAEFYDLHYENGNGNGLLYFYGKPTPELIDELDLKPAKHRESHYFTTLQKMGELGWELKFVTPTGIQLKSGRLTAGPIDKSYIFQKLV